MFVEGQIFAGMAGPIVIEGGLDKAALAAQIPAAMDHHREHAGQGRQDRSGRSRHRVHNRRSMSTGPEPDRQDSIPAKSRAGGSSTPTPTASWYCGSPASLSGCSPRTPTRSFTRAPSASSRSPPVPARRPRARGSPREVHVEGPPVQAVPRCQRREEGRLWPNQTLLTVRSTGRAAHDRFPTGRSRILLLHRSPQEAVDRNRTIVFKEMPTARPHGLPAQRDDVRPEPHRRDDEARLGRAVDPGQRQYRVAHFHIHINDFQVVSVAGKRVPYVDYEDNVALPPNRSVSC